MHISILLHGAVYSSVALLPLVLPHAKKTQYSYPYVESYPLYRTKGSDTFPLDITLGPEMASSLVGQTRL